MAKQQRGGGVCRFDLSHDTRQINHATHRRGEVKTEAKARDLECLGSSQGYYLDMDARFKLHHSQTEGGLRHQLIVSYA